MTKTPIALFFESKPSAKPLFDAVAIAVLTRFPETSFKIQKSQIALVSTKPYAALWLPLKPISDRPEVYLILSFGLDRRLNDPRIAEVNEPYPQRFMHHVLISSAADLDEIVLGFLEQAIIFSNRRR